MKINIILTEYERWHQPYFEILNRAWVEKDFKLEELFKKIPLEPGTYARADVKMELRFEAMLSSEHS